MKLATGQPNFSIETGDEIVSACIVNHVDPPPERLLVSVLIKRWDGAQRLADAPLMQFLAVAEEIRQKMDIPLSAVTEAVRLSRVS